MKLFCSGFNLYGQFVKCPDLIVDGFIDHPFDQGTNLELAQTVSVAIQDGHVFLHGGKNGQTHQVQKIPTPTKVTAATCTETRALLLTQDGLLFKLDFLGDEPSVLPLPNLPDDDRFAKIACGSKINLALSQQGHLFNLPNKLEFRNRNVREIRAGREHGVILDTNGDVFSFGRGSRGQLGHGNLEDELNRPRLVEALAGIKISKIGAGGWHSCALSAEGDLYTWGWNANGQLGFGGSLDESVSVMASPRVVDFENLDTNVVDVACGARHTVALLDDGKLFGAGWNKYRQLGNVVGQSENVTSMTFLHDFFGSDVSQLKCGPWSTAVIVH